MKLSDYVARFLADAGIGHVFVVTGGAVAHLIDSVARHPGIDYVPALHEQTAAMAVDGYARMTGHMGAAMVTTGPGVTNLMTGIACLYYDSLPSIFIAGQVSTQRLSRNTPGVRQLGFQESPHIDMVRPIVKYAVLVEDAARIRYELEKAVYLANAGRPGPVFVDIPDDLQRQEIDPDALDSFTPPANVDRSAEIDGQVEKLFDLIAEAERPVLVLGAGIRIAKQEAAARRLADKLGFPIGLTWAATDMYSSGHPLNIGGFGISATRRGNFAVQNADLVLSIGSRLDSHATGTPIAGFARGAKKIIVDIDAGELAKFAHQGMNVDLPIRADIRDFFAVMDRKLNRIRTRDLTPWLARIADWRRRYPACPPEYEKQKGSVNPYAFLKTLSRETRPDEVMVMDTGANLIQTFQAYAVTQGQRLFSALNNSPMGYALAGSIGACFANCRRRVICIIGDGGLQANMQELATVAHHRLPIKIFLFNNHGYGIINQTQDDWLDSRYCATNSDAGVADPDYAKIARAYGLDAVTIRTHRAMARKIRAVLDHAGPILCNLELDPGQRIVPMVKAGRPIEDPQPLMDRDEFRANMIVAPDPRSI